MTGRPDPLESKYNVALLRMIRNRFPNQYAFAKNVKVDNSFLSNVLYYRKELKPDKLEKWAEVLKVSPKELQATMNK